MLDVYKRQEFGFGKDKTFNRLKAIIDNLPNLQVVAVAGRNEKMKERFDELVKTTRTESNVKILSFTNQVPELMSVSDLVITKPGGLTTTESLASGLPLIIIDPLPGQEEENAEFIENSGAGIDVYKRQGLFIPYVFFFQLCYSSKFFVSAYLF